MQLRWVVALIGKSQHCDFVEQISMELADSQRGNPDMVVYTPHNRHHCRGHEGTLQAYLDAVEAQSIPVRDAALPRVAQQVGARARELSPKDYWNSSQKIYQKTLDFAVMFLSGEFLLSVALNHELALMDRIVEQNVVLASSNTLKALLKTVALERQEVILARETTEIRRPG